MLVILNRGINRGSNALLIRVFLNSLNILALGMLLEHDELVVAVGVVLHLLQNHLRFLLLLLICIFELLVRNLVMLLADRYNFPLLIGGTPGGGLLVGRRARNALLKGSGWRCDRGVLCSDVCSIDASGLALSR